VPVFRPYGEHVSVPHFLAELQFHAPPFAGLRFLEQAYSGWIAHWIANVEIAAVVIDLRCHIHGLRELVRVFQAGITAVIDRSQPRIVESREILRRRIAFLAPDE